MSEDWLQTNTAESGEEVDAELMAEYQRELDRHEAARRMVKLKEQEAIEAKKRAEELLKKHQLQIESRDDNRSKLNALASLSENARSIVNQQFGEKPGVGLGQTVLNLQEKLAKNSSQPQLPQQPQPLQSTSEVSRPTETESTEEKTANAAIDVENVSDATNDAIEPDVDINAMVQRIEAKCANVREELGRMAVSEQYMRTKQAQLVAKKREKEALEAQRKATIKEKEAQEMRRKVEELTQLLAARKAKLKATEHIVEKKATVVEKVEKILNNKERRATYIEKQKMDHLLFEKKVNK